MRVCPSCSFANEERFPACLVCNTLLVDVAYTPSTDVNSPEYERQALREGRHKSTRKQIRFAALLYVVFITGTAVYPGLIFVPRVLALYGVGSVAVATAMAADFTGQFSTSFFQGLLSLGLVLYFGPLQPFVFFMLIAHIVVPAVFWHWIDTIHNLNR